MGLNLTDEEGNNSPTFDTTNAEAVREKWRENCDHVVITNVGVSQLTEYSAVCDPLKTIIRNKPPINVYFSFCLTNKTGYGTYLGVCVILYYRTCISITCITFCGVPVLPM